MALKTSAHSSATVSLLIAWLFASPSHALYAMVSTSQFQEWYPKFGRTFEFIRDNNCSAQYALYLTGNKTNVPVDWLTGGATTNKLTQPLADCILSKTSDFIKGNMGSAAVVLGLTPTILSALGPTIDEVATLAVLGRKPLLAFLVAGSSPVINPWAMVNTGTPNQQSARRDGAVNMLQDLPCRYHTSSLRLGSAKILVVEYLALLSAIAVLIWTCTELAFRTICNFSPESSILPLVWTWVSLVFHLPGSYAMSLRLRVVSDEGNALSWSFGRWIRNQFVPYKKRAAFEVRQNQESFMYLVICWFSNFLIVLLLILGTLVWSSLLFISVRDSVTVIARYMLCQLISKAVLKMELATLRDAMSARTLGGSGGNGMQYELTRRYTADSDGSAQMLKFPGYTHTERYDRDALQADAGMMRNSQDTMAHVE